MKQTDFIYSFNEVTQNGNLISIVDGGVIQRDYTDLIP